MTIPHTYSPHIAQVLGALNAENAHSVVKYVDRDFVVKATAPHPRRAHDRNRTVLLTWGKPNYTERAFIKDCLAAGEPFPVKKLQIKPFKAAGHK